MHDVHGILKCQRCKIRYDRDVNASINMVAKAWFIIFMNGQLPDCWTRKKGEEDIIEHLGEQAPLQEAEEEDDDEEIEEEE